MSTHSQSRRGATKNKGLAQATSSIHPNDHGHRTQDILQKLQDVLRRGMAIESTLWTFHSMDWVADVQAADIDNDGDIEILVGSRDGFVRALTRWGAIKWEQLLEGSNVSAIFAVPFSETTNLHQARVIVGTRRGKVLALDKGGERVEDWEYDTGRMIRQIYISPHTPGNVIIGSEDRCIHVLDSASGKPRWDKYRTNGWVRCVFSYDIDGDGKDEILGGSGDKYLYILDNQGNYLDKLNIGHQVYALFATPLEVDGPVNIITSSNRKDLTAWTITRQRKKQWRHKKEWEKSPKDNLFGNRVHSIYVADINHDKLPEILVGSEDGYLYILDHHGTPLWKHNFDGCVYSVHAADINFDGQIEILVGTEDNSAYAMHIELTDNPYELIRDTYNEAICIYAQTPNELTKILTTRERTLLRDFTQDASQPRHPQMEMEDAINWMAKRAYEKALSIFLRLLQQKVQYYWAQPIKTKGYIWTECFGNVYDGRTYEIIVGTDEGYISAFNIEKNEDKQLWTTQLGDRVRMVQAGITNPEGYDSIVAILASHRLVILDRKGNLVKEHTFEDKQDWARSVSIHKSSDGNSGSISEIVIGLENKKVSIWDAELQLQIATIDTPQGISAVYTHDITGSGTAEIVSGSLNNQVYVHSRQGEELWRFETQGRVEALRVEDIDKDGHAEVIVGSEDRYVYVLDHEGHLKWCYRTMRGVMDVDVCDIKLENDPDDEKERKWKVLVSGIDGYLYMFDADGDLVWKYKSNNRIRTVRAKDLNRDGKFEIAVASENQLELLQILNRKELIDHIQHCWQGLLDTDSASDRREIILRLTHHSDEYIRAFALAKLAGQYSRSDEDFKRFQEALKDEDSLQVKRELVRAIVVLCRVPFHQGENILQARQLLQKLSNDTEEEIRLAIIDILPLLLDIEERLCFDYLEDFTRNVNPWIRRAVVRQLDKLVEKYPERTLRILTKIVRDEDEWVRQECGRVLAHYFDKHTHLLVRDMLALLYQGTDPLVLQQISYSASIPAVKQLFAILVKLLTQLQPNTMGDMLGEALATIGEANALGPFYGEELLQLYEEFQQLFQTKTIDAIARYQRITRSDMMVDVPSYKINSARQVMQAFDALQQVVRAVKIYERREAMGDRATSLIDAIDILESIRNKLHEEELLQTQQLAGVYRLPENIILSFLLEQWSKVVKAELYRLRGDAHLFAEIRNKVIQPEEEVVISLFIRNDGRSPADNVYVELEKSSDFDIVGGSERMLAEVSTSAPATIDFTIRPLVSSPRLSFQLTYDDAERRAKQTVFADVVNIQSNQRPYRPIPNPYTSGTPIRDRKMFYGRKEDLEALHEKLSSVTANKIVVLSGQRRMGKTSLMYQLANELSQGPYIPVLIDLQSLALASDAGQFLYGFASHIHAALLYYKKVNDVVPDSEAFSTNPTAAFNDYLERVLQVLPGYKLVFLLDEFERLEEHFQQGKLKQDILNYLRSLMQHRQGLNFLLAGAPRIRHMTESYWSIFFNIAVQHFLTKLKPQEAIDLITLPVSGYLEYDPLALERVRRLTGDRPYLIHVISERLIAYCNRQKKSYVTVNDVNIVLDIILEEQTSSIQWIWDDATPVERFILSILAQEKGEEERTFSLNDIRAEYDTQGIPFSKKEVTEALQNLVRGDIVEERLDGIQFRIPVGLTKEWLRKAKPPERVVREELLSDD